MPIKVTLHSLKNANEKQRDLIERARANLERAVNHPDFRSRVLKAPYRETNFYDGSHTTSKKPDEIAAIILAGMERGTPSDGEIDMAIKLDHIARPVLGSTVRGKLPWRTAYWFVDLSISKNDTITPARHLMHEWLHVAGFVHKKNDGPRPDVAYLVGDIVRDLLKQPSLAGDAQEDEEVVRAFEEGEEEIVEEAGEEAESGKESGKEEGGAAGIPCPFGDGDSREWAAWVNAMPGGERKLIVVGEVKAPKGYRGRLTLTHTDRMLPPNQYAELVLVEAGGAEAGWGDVRDEMKALADKYGSVIVNCHGERVVRISPVRVTE